MLGWFTKQSTQSAAVEAVSSAIIEATTMTVPSFEHRVIRASESFDAPRRHTWPLPTTPFEAAFRKAFQSMVSVHHKGRKGFLSNAFCERTDQSSHQGGRD
ncbi:hypothetical protein CDAR_567551 [Caerostris darwini]|uniref:Uncharacterized protein n=1 Tax=Caerostris darwini TaxID=1538125 RepID=A0AAV4QZY5_9ARAC|nr:hypothetical protein CDAR_567551 [Caerostris darwini]